MSSDLTHKNCHTSVDINYLNSSVLEESSKGTELLKSVETPQNDINHDAEDLKSPVNEGPSEHNERQRIFEEIFNNKNSIDITG